MTTLTRLKQEQKVKRRVQALREGADGILEGDYFLVQG